MARKKKREGISLIALLITIVVLIILAGVSISAIKNNNGIINQTSHAQEKKNASEEKEAIEWAAAQMVGNANNLTGQIADKQTEEEITNEKNDFEAQIKKYIGTKAEAGNDFEFQIYAPGSVYLTQSNQEMTVTSDLYIVKFIKSGNIYTVDGNGNVHYQEEQSTISTEDRDGVRISPAEISINNGTTQELSIITNAQIANVKISSSDENIIELVRENNNVKVENGKFYVIAKKLGKAKVTVELTNGKKAVTYIYVHQEPTKITLTKKKDIIDMSSAITTVQLSYEIEPDTANYKTGVTWTSDKPEVATVDSNGLVTGKSNGTAIITVETENGKTDTCEIVVETTPVSLELDKNQIKLDISTKKSEQLNASIYPTTSNANNAVNWSSDKPEIATVDANGYVTGVSNGNAKITAETTNGKSATCNVLVQTTPISVTLNKTNVTLDMSGEKTLQLEATINPTSANINTGITWSSTNSAVATVDSNGLVTAMANGSATITVKTGNGKTASCTVTVKTTPVSIELDKTKAVIDLGVSKTLQLSSKINPNTTNAENGLDWSSNNEKVATVNSSGVVTGVSNGSATITVTTKNGKSASSIITVQTSPISISLNKTTETLDLTGTNTTQLSVTYNPTSSNVNTGITWSSNNTGVATVDDKGLVTAKANGSVTITARTENGKTATCAIKVQTSPIGITLNKDKATVDLSSSTKTVQLSVTAYNPTTSNVNTGITWSSSNPNIASVSTSGLVTAKAKGTAVITATTTNGKKATCTITVIKNITSLTVSAPSTTLETGATMKLTANVQPTDTTESITWSSKNTGVATVNASTGQVTGKSNGTVEIVAKSSTTGKTASVTIKVQTSPQGISLNKTSETLDMSGTKTLQLSVTAYNPTTSNVNTGITWSSSNSNIASVSTSGLVTAKTNGKATITATTTNGKTASCSILVQTSPTSVTLNKTSETLDMSGTTTVQLTATINPGSANINTGKSWSSSNPGVATVNSSTGLVTAKANGTATITVRTGNGKTASCTVTVQTSPKGISLNRSNASLDMNGTKTVQLSVSSYNPSSSNVSKTITWSSSNSNVASVSTSGVVTAKSNGNATITAKTANGKTATCSILVQTSPASVSLNRTSATLDMSGTTTLQLSATLNPSSTVNINTGKTWSSSNSNIASVNTAGLVTAKSNGTATITVRTGNGKTASCSITVQTSPKGINLNKTSTSINLSSSTKTVQLSVSSYNPSSSNVNKTITWSSNNSNIASVNSNGLVTGKSNGTATITARTANGKTASCTVTVWTSITSISASPDSFSIKIGNSATSTLSYSPSSTTDSLKCSSANGNIATASISGKTLTINAVGAGKTTITVKSSSSSASKTINVSVYLQYTGSWSNNGEAVSGGWHTVGTLDNKTGASLTATGSASVWVNKMKNDRYFALRIRGKTRSGTWENVWVDQSDKYTFNFGKNRKFSATVNEGFIDTGVTTEVVRLNKPYTEYIFEFYYSTNVSSGGTKGSSFNVTLTP